MSERKPLAVTMGDPAGVGPELCLRLLADESLVAECRPSVYGDVAVLERVAQVTGLPFNAERVVDLRQIKLDQSTPGQANAATGAAAYAYIQRAIDDALAGRVSAVATAPISKEALHAAGHRYPGHTEIFAERCQAARSCMMQYSDEITCSFVTTHIGYRDVPQQLTIERIVDVIELTAAAIACLRQETPRLVVCGLNPHAGEHGLFGDREEERIIIPAIERARACGAIIEGPLPADTAFLLPKRRSTDAFVCMYHDQGHIPVKALAFDTAVNTTLGLPIVRTSVDHGTACDIAWQGVASPSSLFSAARLALRLAQSKPQ